MNLLTIMEKIVITITKKMIQNYTTMIVKKINQNLNHTGCLW